MGSGGSNGGTSARTETANLSDAIKKALLGLPEDERKDFYVHSGVNEEMYRVAADETLEKWAKYDSYTVNESLPTLTGSEKQVSWAEDIRQKLLVQEVESIHRRAPATVEGKKQLIEQAKAHGMDVDSYSDVLNQALQQDKLFKWLKETTSAKELIDIQTGKTSLSKLIKSLR